MFPCTRICSQYWAHLKLGTPKKGIAMKRLGLDPNKLATLPVGEHHDGSGLSLYITPHSRTWIQRVSIDGKRQKIRVGKFPEIKLSKARENGALAKANSFSGQSTNKTSEIVTFQKVMDLWLAKYEKEKSAQTYSEAKAYLKNHAFALFDRPIKEITRHEIFLMLQPIAGNNPKTGLPDPTRKVQLPLVKKVGEKIGQVMTFGMDAGLCDFNVAINIRSAFAHHTEQNLATLPAEDLPKLFQKMHQSSMKQPAKDLILIQLLAGVRCNEIVHAKWKYIKNDVLTIEKQYMKGQLLKKKPHNIYLSIAAQEILARTEKKSEWIFPLTTDSARPANPGNVGKWLRDNGFQDELTAHGFRTMLSTWANAQKVVDHSGRKVRRFEAGVIELCIAHTVKVNGNSVQSDKPTMTYDQKTKEVYDTNPYAEEQREVMQAWGEFVKSAWLSSFVPKTM
jgi:integrase